jgi:hypothetical protein
MFIPDPDHGRILIFYPSLTPRGEGGRDIMYVGKMYCSTKGMKTAVSYVRRSGLGFKEAPDLDPQH